MEVIALTNNVRFAGAEEIARDECSEEVAIVETLSKRLEDELRLARKENFLEEILLPHGLTIDIAKRVFQMAELEPCGLRGCLLYIEFELKEEKRKISSIKCDPSIPSTFELYLTLRQAANGWNLFLPQFWKKIARGTVMISAEYDLQKKKLYRTQNDF
ncbi:protein scylla-like [Coccinella septempunctata]|uniref:protein scylla-like n=1 Tax=Coccinella septempunctata TaxID=41139 RepID=UPI001D083EF3|nr:protein scylla-like [Coccinella septempunctata]